MTPLALALTLVIFSIETGVETPPATEADVTPTPVSTIQPTASPVPLEPLDALSMPRELRLSEIDIWAPLDAWGSISDPRIPPQLRVADRNDAFDVLASADDSADPTFEKEPLMLGGGSGHFRCSILMYHGFHDPPRTLYEISSYDFEQQCRFLRDSGVEVIPLSVLVDALTTGQYSMVPDRSVVITVDDGYQNFYTIARPILKKYGFPATLCLYTNFIGSGKGALSWSELTEMLGEGWIEIASHSLSHPNLARSRGRFPSYGDWLYREIVSSRSIIENHTAQPVKAFSYPYGTYNDSARAVVKNNNYEAALTVHPGAVGPDSNVLHLPRYGIYRSCTISRFARYIQGGEVNGEELELYMKDAETEAKPLY